MYHKGRVEKGMAEPCCSPAGDELNSKRKSEVWRGSGLARWGAP